MFDFSGFFSRFPLFAYAGFFIHSTAYAACCTLALLGLALFGPAVLSAWHLLLAIAIGVVGALVSMAVVR
jgi:hypothetical protein